MAKWISGTGYPQTYSQCSCKVFAENEDPKSLETVVVTE